jgi:hypothetical protein
MKGPDSRTTTLRGVLSVVLGGGVALSFLWFPRESHPWIMAIAVVYIAVSALIDNLRRGKDKDSAVIIPGTTVDPPTASLATTIRPWRWFPILKAREEEGKTGWEHHVGAL